MNEELRTYILENMDAGTVIDFPTKEKHERNINAPKMMSMKALPKEYKCAKTLRPRKRKEELDIEDEGIVKCDEMIMGCLEASETYIPGMKLDDYINNHLPEYNVFQKLLFEMIDERGLKDSDVYNKVGMSRKTFSKIRSSENYHPSRETVILLGLSLELPIEEMERLLDSAAYSLPRNNAADLIIRFACQSKIYNVMEVNDMLEEYGCKLLGE